MCVWPFTFRGQVPNHDRHDAGDLLTLYSIVRLLYYPALIRALSEQKLVKHYMGHFAPRVPPKRANKKFPF